MRDGEEEEGGDGQERGENARGRDGVGMGGSYAFAVRPEEEGDEGGRPC